MSRTQRRVPRDHFRRPSRNIMRRDMDKVRQKAIPPNAYEDIPFSGGQHDFYGALHDLIEKGFESDQIVKRLTKRFKVEKTFILELLRRSDKYKMRVANLEDLESRIARLERRSHTREQKRASMSVRDSSKVVQRSLNELQNSLDEMEASLMAMPSFTSDDRYYAEIARRWRTLRNNINTIKAEIDYIKGAY